MKAIIIISVLIFSSCFIQAQTITDEIVKKIPALPKDSCNISRAAMEAFQQNVANAIEQTEAEIDRLNEIVDQKSEGSEELAKENAMKQMSQQYGLSQEQMAQMKSGNMSAADKQKMANQILQQQTNMSMGEVQNLSKMSDAGKKAYTEAYAAEMQASVQANPEKYKVNEAAGNMHELISSQQAVLGRINSNAQKIGGLYSSIDSDPAIQRSYKKIDEWHDKLTSMIGIDYGQGKQMDSLSMLIQREQIKICDKYTPTYRAALRQHFSVMKSSFSDQEELGRITSELTKMQTGVVLPVENTEVAKLQSVKGYLNNLKDAYKFKLYFLEDN